MVKALTPADAIGNEDVGAAVALEVELQAMPTRAAQGAGLQAGGAAVGAGLRRGGGKDAEAQPWVSV
jgi:hypothetical protein